MSASHSRAADGYGEQRARAAVGGRRTWIRLRRFVDGVDELPRAHQPIDGAPGHRMERSALSQVFGVWRRHGEQRNRTERLVLVAVQHAELGFTDTDRILQHALEYRLELAGRGADDLQHVGGGGLLLEGFREIIGTLAQLVEQACILDRDDGLIREGLDQRELLVGEGSNIGPPHRDHANEDTFATHRHTEKGPDAASIRSFSINGTPVRIGLRIEDLYCPVLNRYAPDDRAVSWPNPATVCPLSKPRRGIVIHGKVVQLTVRPKDEPLLGRTKLRGILDQSFENGLQVEGGAADDLEHVGGGGLLLQ
jgi:hypothetical protein